MMYGRRSDPRGRSTGTNAPGTATKREIYFVDPGTGMQCILGSDGVIRDKTGHTMVYDQEGKIHIKD